MFKWQSHGSCGIFRCYSRELTLQRGDGSSESCGEVEMFTSSVAATMWKSSSHPACLSTFGTLGLIDDSSAKFAWMFPPRQGEIPLLAILDGIVGARKSVDSQFR